MKCRLEAWSVEGIWSWNTNQIDVRQRFHLLFTILLLVSGLAEAEPATPSQVYQLSVLLQNELELLREKTGGPRNIQPELPVSNVAPREVFFQAQTACQKADRLAFQYLRVRKPEPGVPSDDIVPQDVYEVVEATLQRIRLVKKELGISQSGVKPERDPSKTSSDVYKSIVQSNRQLNLLLEKQYAPADVFEKVTKCVLIVGRLLSRFPGATRIPDPPPFEDGKRPADVYAGLLECYGILDRVTKDLEIEILDLDVKALDYQNAAPSDVYDIASLLASELSYLYRRAPDLAPPPASYLPGRRAPSDVYQRVGLLQFQLGQLEELSRQNPGWWQDR